MAAVASNRAVSATVLLTLLVTSGCLAMASAVPVANARRLQQFADSGGLASQLRALTAILQKLSDQAQSALQTDSLPADLKSQLQNVAASFAAAQGQLTSIVEALLSLPTSIVLSQPKNQLLVQSLLDQFKTELQVISAQFQNPEPVDGCFTTQKVNVLAAVSKMTSQLKTIKAGLPIFLQPLARPLISVLQKLENDVRQVNSCAPGLETLPIIGEGIIATVGELLSTI